MLLAREERPKMDYQAMMYLKATTNSSGKVEEIKRFIQRLNISLTSSKNLFLNDKITIVVRSGYILVVVPLFVGFPWVFFPLYYFPKLVYFVSMWASFNFQHKIKGVKLRLMSSLTAAGVLYEVLLEEKGQV